MEQANHILSKLEENVQRLASAIEYDQNLIDVNASQARSLGITKKSIELKKARLGGLREQLEVTQYVISKWNPETQAVVIN